MRRAMRSPLAKGQNYTSMGHRPMYVTPVIKGAPKVHVIGCAVRFSYEFDRWPKEVWDGGVGHAAVPHAGMTIAVGE